jgi:hypothetical protein
MLPLLRRLGVVHADPASGEYEFMRAELQTALAALEELGRLASLQSLTPDSLKALREEYEQRAVKLREEMSRLAESLGDLSAPELYQARHHLLLVEKSRAIETYQEGVISPAVHDLLLADIDARLLELESNGGAGLPAAEKNGGEPRPPTG